MSITHRHVPPYSLTLAVILAGMVPIASVTSEGLATYLRKRTSLPYPRTPQGGVHTHRTGHGFAEPGQAIGKGAGLDLTHTHCTTHACWWRRRWRRQWRRRRILGGGDRQGHTHTHTHTPIMRWKHIGSTSLMCVVHVCGTAVPW